MEELYGFPRPEFQRTREAVIRMENLRADMAPEFFREHNASFFYCTLDEDIPPVDSYHKLSSGRAFIRNPVDDDVVSTMSGVEDGWAIGTESEDPEDRIRVYSRSIHGFPKSSHVNQLYIAVQFENDDRPYLLDCNLDGFGVLQEDVAADPQIVDEWTGDITAGDDVLSTSEDLSGYEEGHVVTIAGAGEDGRPLTSAIVDSDSSSLTLETAASSSVTGAEISVAAAADAWILYRSPGGRFLRQTDENGDPITRKMINRWRSFPVSANTKIFYGWRYGEWVIIDADCDTSSWPWDAE